MNYLSSNLKYLRNKKNISLAKLGVIFNKTRTTIFRWENGTREPCIDDLIKLSKFYNINIDKLLKVDLTKGV